MRRIITVLLCAVMLLGLVACGSEGGTDSDDPQDEAPDDAEIPGDQADRDTAEDDKDAGDTDTDADAETDADQQGGQDQSEDPGDVITFDEITVVDNDECTIKLIELDPDNFWGYTVKAYLENKSPDKTYVFSLQDAFINGVECTSLFATDVAPEKKTNENVTVMTVDMEEAGITEFTDIELSFIVYDSNDWTADAVAEETVHIYPYGEENAVKYVREAGPEDIVIMDNDYATVIVTGYEIDEIWGYTADLFLVNKSDKELMFAVDDASVNGFMADPFWAHSVMPGKCAFSEMSWSDETFAENGIEEVNEIEFTLQISDANDLLSSSYAEEIVVLNP